MILLVVNTLVVFVLTGFALLLPRTDYILSGLTATVICYAFLSLRYQKVPPSDTTIRATGAITGDQP
jgi:hypothetical protein